MSRSKENPWERDYGTSKAAYSPLTLEGSDVHSRYRLKAKFSEVHGEQNIEMHQMMRKKPLGNRIFDVEADDFTLSNTSRFSANSETSSAEFKRINTSDQPVFSQIRDNVLTSTGVKRCTRHAPQTELETFGAMSIWVVLLLPGVMALLIFLIPSQHSMQIDRIPLSTMVTIDQSKLVRSPSLSSILTNVDVYRHNCSTQHVLCEQFSLRADEEDRTINIMLHPTRTVNALGFLEVSLGHTSSSSSSMSATRRILRGRGGFYDADSVHTSADFRLHSHASKELPTSPHAEELFTLEVDVTPTILDTPDLVTVAQLLEQAKSLNLTMDWKSAQIFVENTLRKIHVGTSSLGVASLDLPAFLNHQRDTQQSSNDSNIYGDVELPLLYTSFAPPNLRFFESTETLQLDHSNPARDLMPAGSASPSAYSKEDALHHAQSEQSIGYSHWFQVMLTLRVRRTNESSIAVGDTTRRQLASSSSNKVNKALINKLLKDKEIVIISQSELFLVFDVILRLLLASMTLCVYYIWWVRAWPHLQLAASASPRVDSPGSQMFGSDSWATCVCRYVSSTWVTSKRRAAAMCAVLLPEQMTSAWMLFFLFIWQSPLSALISLSTLCGVKNLPSSLVLAAMASRSLAKYGLFFCALVYIDGLRYFPGDMQYLDDDEEEASDMQYEERCADDAGAYDPLSSISQSSKTADNDAFKRSSQRKPFVSKRTAPMHSEASPLSWKASRLGKRLNDDEEFVLTDSNGLPLTGHHVLSTEFPDFIWRKVLLLLLSWVSVCLFYQHQAKALLFYQAPAGDPGTTAFASASSQMENSQQSLAFLILIGLFSQLGINYWILLLILASQRTSRRLKKMAYSLSRFRQLAFRLFLWQFYFWVGFLVMVALFRWNECSRNANQQYGFFSAGYWLVVEPIGDILQQWKYYLLGEARSVGDGSSRFTGDSLSRLQVDALIYLSSDYSPPFGFSQSIILVSLSALCYTIAYALTAPRLGDAEVQAVSQECRSSNFSLFEKGSAEEKDVLQRNYSFHQNHVEPSFGGEQADTTSPVSYGDHGFVPLERDMPPLRSWDIFENDMSSALLQNPKLAYALLHKRITSSLRRLALRQPPSGKEGGTSESREISAQDFAQPFCLETACVLLEASYQAYFRPTGEGCEVPESLDWGLHSGTSDPVELKPDSKATGENPFDSDSDESKANSPFNAVAESSLNDAPSKQTNAINAEPMWTSGPAMELQRCGQRLLSTFYDTTYFNLGYVSHNDVSVGLNEGSSMLPSRIVVCYRGTTEVKQAISDIKFNLVPLPDFRLTRAYFRKVVLKEIYKKAAQSRVPDVINISSGDGLLDQNGSGSACSSPSAKDSSVYQGSNCTPGQDSVMSPTSENEYRNESYRSGLGASESVVLEMDAADEPSEQEQRSLWSTLSVAGTALRSVVSRLPVLQHTLPLIHLGFRDMYLCIRDQALSAVVHAMYTVRQRRRALVSSSASLHAELQKIPKKSASFQCSDSEQNLLMPALELQFCGHSLGGVLATLTAYDMSLNMPVILQALDDLDKADRMEPNNITSSKEVNFMTPQRGVDASASKQAPRTPTASDETRRTESSRCVESYPHISMYSYGQPKPGNAAFCNHISSYLHTHYRVELDGDIVATIPPSYFRGYAHAGTQVIVDPHSAGTLIVNPTLVESQLLAGHHANVQKHAMVRYRQCLLACFEPDELAHYIRREFASSLPADHSAIGRVGETPLERELALRLGIRNTTRDAVMPSWIY